ncbi:efflux RND transporter permease subunit [Candidatus Gracilibacteria bacterium]|nr:MAG: efflux RND transporter permease subunit [Candidatus Gracilibacteria bacterium]
MVEFLKNKIVFFWMIIFMGFIVGIYSFFTIPKENSPAMDIPMFVVNTVNPGADPKSIENQITNKLEDEFKSISGIKRLESVSNPNFSTIIVTFNDSKNINDAKLELDSAVNKASLPQNIKKPVIKQVSPDDIAVYSFSIAGNNLSKDIYKKAKDLENEIKSIEGISDVIIAGKPEKKINIYLDEKKINEFGIDITNVKNLLSNIFLKQPIGKKDIGGNLYTYEIETFESNLENLLEQIKQTDLLSYNSQSIKVKDVASVFLEEDSKIEKSFIVQGNDSLNAVSFGIKITPGNDVEGIIKNILKKTEKFQKQNPDLKVYETYSRLVEINDIFGTFVSNFRQSGLIILVILFLFIGFKMSLGVTFSFPLVYFLTFIALSFMGYTFNNIVSFALVLTLGIMVDNLIVVTEGLTNEYKKDKNIDFWTALKFTLEKYSGSIVAGTLTTIAMFIPILFLLSGTIGKFVAPMSTTIIITLIASIFVAFFLLPILLLKFLPKETKTPYLGVKLERASELLGKFTGFFLRGKKRAFLVVVAFWGIFALSIGSIAAGIIKTDFLPPTDQDNIWVNIKYQSGLSSEKTQIETNKILTDLKVFLEKNFKNDIEYYYVNIGNTYSTNAIGGASNVTSDNQAYINIKLIPGGQRNYKAYEISEKIQDFINKSIKEKYPLIKDIFTIGKLGIAGGKDIGFHIIGDNLEEISKYIEKIKPEFEKINGVYNISSNLEFTSGKIKYFIDTNKVMQNGMSLESFVTLFASIKNSDYSPNGIPLHTFTEFGKDDITMSLFTNYKGNVEDLKIGENFVSASTKERNLEAELKNIQHINTKLQISLEADKKSDVALGSITGEIEKIIDKNPLPDGLTFKYNSNISDQNQSTSDLAMALGVGILLMFLVLVYQFNSFGVSMIVLTSTILSVIGIVIFLGFFGLPMSFPAQLGIFGVIGVGVNNSILFTDLFNSKEKYNLKKDLANTVTERFGAIFLTTFTTIAGLITLALKDELWGSLAIAFIGGLTINVLIVLVYLPCFYLLITKEKKQK